MIRILIPIILSLFPICLNSQSFIEFNKIDYYLNELKLNDVFILPQRIVLQKAKLSYDSIKVHVIYTLDKTKDDARIERMVRAQCYKKELEDVFNVDFPKRIERFFLENRKYLQYPIIVYKSGINIDKNKYYIGVHTFVLN